MAFLRTCRKCQRFSITQHMKKTGLQYRFSPEVRTVWLYWYSCNVCHYNQPDALHHIVSPSSRHHVDTPLNSSVLNSCPIHNTRHPNADQLRRQGYSGQGIDIDCHINNEAWLYSDEGIRTLLSRTLHALVELEYTFNERDRQFLRIYSHLYTKTDLEMVK